MKHFYFKNSNDEEYSRITTARGVYNYFYKLKDAAVMFVISDNSKIAVVGYNNIRNYLKNYEPKRQN